MSWTPIDFQGISTLQAILVERLEKYLNEKETTLVDHLLAIAQHRGEDFPSPAPPSIRKASLKLSDAAEAFAKNARAPMKKGQELSDVISQVNDALWKYTEVLEGCVVELFQQLKLMEIGQWHAALPKILEALKELLLHRIEDLIWVIRRLDLSLKQHDRRETLKWSWWRDLIERYLFKGNALDGRLIVNLTNTEKFLKSQHHLFTERYKEYLQQSHKAQPVVAQLSDGVIYPTLEKEERDLFGKIVYWLKLRDLNIKERGTLASQISVTLKNGVGIDQAIKLFRTYRAAIEKLLYSMSRELKRVPLHIPGDAPFREDFKKKVTSLVEELRVLVSAVARYREFLLKTDSNPYVRSRLGFTEWIVGPEPLKTRTLMQCVFDIQALEKLCFILLASIEKENPTAMAGSLYANIEAILHEMSSPLISQSMMRKKGGEFLGYVDECNILGCWHFEVVAYVGTSLNRAMQLDWKYHVLHEFPLFHDIVTQYRGLFDVKPDSTYHGRIEKIRRLFSHIEEWMAREDIDAHIDEIATDMNDMKAYLQDFLAAVQRLEKDSSISLEKREVALKQLSYQLFEYRYFFGDFFYHLTKGGMRTGMQIRNRFLFVDQYLETIDVLLSEALKD